MNWAGCNYWVNQGKHPSEPVGTATSMHNCEGCEHDGSCPLQKEENIWPHVEAYDKFAVDVTNEFRRQERLARKATQAL
jgi:hypothetical protein